MAFTPNYKIGTVIAGKFMALGFHFDDKEEKFEDNVFIIKLENEVKRSDRSPYIVQRVQIFTEAGKIRSYRRMFTKNQVRIPSLGEAIPWSLFSQENNKGEEIKTKQTNRRKYSFYDDDSLKKNSTIKY
jgi:hypothetical protein